MGWCLSYTPILILIRYPRVKIYCKNLLTRLKMKVVERDSHVMHHFFDYMIKIV